MVLFCVACGVACCNRYGEAEARLVAIDSLVCGQPDSALSLLADINGDSLPTDLQAYHSLLTVQALYKAYIPATSDTLIRRAWDYYRDHGPYDRRIRAMLYMGTVAEELGHPDSAMRWYKRTELESRPDDHYHRGYALEKMAILYELNLKKRQSIDMYRKAMEHFSKNDTSNYLFCCQRLSQLYQADGIDADSTMYFIHIVKEVATARNDSTYQAMALAAQVYKLFYDSCYEQSKTVAITAINDFRNYIPTDCWFFAAQSLVKLGDVDSAEIYLNLAPAPVTVADSTLCWHTKALVQSSKGDWKQAHLYEVLSDKIAENEVQNRNALSLSAQEKEIEKEFEARQSQSRQNTKMVIIMAIFAVLLATAMWMFAKSYFQRRKTEEQLRQQIKWLEQNHLSEINKTSLELANTKAQLQTKIDQLRTSQSDADFVKTLYAHLNAAFERNLQPLGEIASDYFQSDKNATLFMSRFQKQFKQLWTNNDVWRQIEQHINDTHNNCIIRLMRLHPDLSNEELHLVMLTILDFNSMAIAICLGYKSQNVVYAMKSKLKKKLHLNSSIEEYLRILE